MSDRPLGPDWWRAVDGQWYAPLVPPAPPRRRRWPRLVVIAVLVAACAAFVIHVNRVDSSGTTTSSPSIDRRVKYCWTLSEPRMQASVSFSNSAGEFTPPMERTGRGCIDGGKFPAGSFVGVNVVNETAGGSVSCEIKINGRGRSHAYASGAYGVANCSGVA